MMPHRIECCSYRSSNPLIKINGLSLHKIVVVSLLSVEVCGVGIIIDRQAGEVGRR